MAAGQPQQKIETAASRARKRKTVKLETTVDGSTTTLKASEMPSDGPGVPASGRSVSQAGKRKAAKTNIKDEAPTKKVKNGTNKTIGQCQTNRERVEMMGQLPPTPNLSSPTTVTPAVQAKINAVKHFVATELGRGVSSLKRDSKNPKIVSIPELDLLGVVITLYFHYELGNPETSACMINVEDGITGRFRAPLHLAGNVDWITLDLCTPTTLEKRIKEKIPHHGVEDVNLLEVELELCAGRQKAQHGLHVWEAEKLVEAAEILNKAMGNGWEGFKKKVDVALMRGGDVDGREYGRVGVCPVRAVEVA